MQTLARFGTKKILVTLSLMVLLGCKQDEFEFSYNSNKNPTGTVTLGSGQTVYTQDRNVHLVFNSLEPYEMTFFVNKNCVYKDAKTWEPYSASKVLELPNEDGVYNIHVMYRNADHFPSACQSVKIVLDRLGPTIAQVRLASRISTTIVSPFFQFDTALDAYSPISLYQARVLQASNSAVVLDWTDVVAPTGGNISLTVALAGGSGYRLEVRARDEAGNYGVAAQSPVFYAGLTTDLGFLNNSGTTTSCSTTSCKLSSGVYKFQVTLSYALPEDITINYSTEDFTAFAGIDYFENHGTMQLPAGNTSASFLVNVHDSFQPGADRSFKVKFESGLSSTATQVSVATFTHTSSTSVAKGTPPVFKSYTLGSYQGCGLTTGNDVYCWGSYPGDYKHMGIKVDLGMETATQLGGAYGNSCVLTNNKEVKCFGAMLSALGTLALGTYPAPVIIPDFVDIKQFGVSNYVFVFLCGVHENGTIRCAGNNSFYHLGNGTNSASATSVLVTGFANPGVDPEAKKVATANSSVCALTVDGAVYCWGSNSSGQVAQPSGTTHNATPTLVSGLPVMTDIEAGHFHFCGTSADDRVFCWGSNSESQVGQPISAGNSYVPTEVPGQTGVQSLALGASSSCAIRLISGQRKIYCWGGNSTGVLGTPYWGFYSTPQEVTQFPGEAISISARNDGICGVNTTGSIYCWGKSYSNLSTETGLPISSATYNYMMSGRVPVNDRFQLQAEDIIAENFTKCIKTMAGKYYCSGVNPLTTPAMTVSGFHALEPKLVSPNPLLGVTVGKYLEFTCYIDTDKQVWCKGQNIQGSLGDGTTTDSAEFKKIDNLNNVKMISSGTRHVCSLNTLNEVWCWGYNSSSQLGFTSSAPHIVSTPVQVSLPAGNIVKLVASSVGNCILLSDGKIYCWGGGSVGQLGNGTSTAAQATLVQVNSSQTFVDIVAGMYSVCAIATGGALYCWGANGNSQLGDGTTVTRLSPTLVSGGLTFKSVSVTDAGACGATTSGEVYCWGFGGSGQLGNGGTANSAVPVKVWNIDGGAVKVVSANYQNAGQTGMNWYTCALIQINEIKQDYKCWGSNDQKVIGWDRGANTTPVILKVDAASP